MTRIAIIGGGPSGLVLLNVLARRGIRAVLYERDERLDSRTQLGGTLDLRVDSGQAAMKGAGLWDPFVQHSRPEGQEFTITDSSGEPLYHYVPPPDAQEHARPEIDRRVLRQILVDGAPPDSIKWGHTFVAASPVAGSNEWELTFANGHKEVVDLLVGADGGRSRVRPLVSDAELLYTGITAVGLSLDPRKHPELSSRVGNGSVFAYENGSGIIAQRNGDGHIRTYALWRHEDPEQILPFAADPQASIAEVLARYEGWAPWLRQLIEAADRRALYTGSMYMLPVGHSWTHRPGVTLMGDAMNLMGPFAGKGANIAMLAGLKLGLALADAVGRPLPDVDAKVAAYEEDITALAAEDAALTEKNMKLLMFSAGGARSMAAAMAQRDEAQK